MWLGACDGCNGIYGAAGLAPGEAVCPECQLPLRIIREADNRDRCREALGLATTPQDAADPPSRRAA